MSKVRYARYVNKIQFSCFQIKICITILVGEKEIRGGHKLQEEAILFLYQFLTNKKSHIDYIISPLRLQSYPTKVPVEGYIL